MHSHRRRPSLRLPPVLLIGLVVIICSQSAPAAEPPIQVAIIGADTSHSPAFAELFNAKNQTGAVARCRVVAAYPGGSPDIPASRDRVEGFTTQLADAGIEIVDRLDELVDRADAFLLESVDGRTHLEQFRAIACGKPVFIDKPAAASAADFLLMMEIAERTNTPFFSASSLRFCPEVRELQSSEELGAVMGAATSTPYKTEPHHPDLFWYGIHGVEALATLLGPGCQQVTRHETDRGLVLHGVWQDGRQGQVWAVATGKPVYSFTVYGDKKVGSRIGYSGYAGLIAQIAEFFVSGQPPVVPEATLEILAMMEAADLSKQRNGRPVSLQEVIEAAHAATANRQ
ncbi:hypothetical protein Pla123a_10110 [Posidoniimonas polymericola]|uniref:Oxidoreductase family, NAD-binding Rossmann fold n=1 Tax=Posidoniimonas polymericola TaxID=2528002 RepID=A0A5C5YTT7_9BACT|nr:gfo/Idh/MocA family oxidoreductase [Posidoniimonas polymericola]TWT78221.1 hypothetical protein Pla123a_10110 [Posidoniimonas polymericola]